MFRIFTSGEWLLHLWEIGVVVTIIATGIISGFSVRTGFNPKVSNGNNSVLKLSLRL